MQIWNRKIKPKKLQKKWIWEGLGVHLGRVWDALGRLMATFSQFWAYFGRIWAFFGRSKSYLFQAWVRNELQEAFWVDFGSLLKGLGKVLGGFGEGLGRNLEGLGSF